MKISESELRKIIVEELMQILDEKKGSKRQRKKKAKKKAKRDACYHKVKSRYKVWPSAYASGALSKCRKVGAKNWGNKSKKNESVDRKDIEKVLKDEGGASGLDPFLKAIDDASEKEIKDILKSMENVGQHEDGDYILDDGEEIEVKKKIEEKKKRKRKRKLTKKPSSETNLRDWFKRKGAKGSKGGWVDCNAPDGKGGYKSCGRSKGEKRKKYPACRPTPSACKGRGKGKKWGKKGGKKK